MRDLPDLLHPGDALVVNDTKVIPARLTGRRIGRDTEPKIEATLTERIDGSRWRAFAKPGKKLAAGDVIRFGDEGKVCFLGQLDATVEAKGEGGEITLSFAFHGPVLDQAIAERGDMPLPPYIASRRKPDDQDRADYQTLFARDEGSVAAPTAGLHFTDDLMARLAARGVAVHKVTLRVGPGTFLPVHADDTAGHAMHAEHAVLTAETATGAERGAWPTAGGSWRSARPRSAPWRARPATTASSSRSPRDTALFITPGYRFKAVDAMMTNFHLPRSTLFMLVSALCGLEVMQRAYAHAIATGYRFYSYGDASLLFRRAMPDAFSFRLIATDGAARRGEMVTPHGHAATPAFMPVGTQATVKGLMPETVRGTGADILLGNTYHLMLRPGAERIAALGGLHKFMNWPRPILTDSGGFQVMSLANLRKISRSTAWCSARTSTARWSISSPERAIEIQSLLGADISMQLDECIKLPNSPVELERAMRLSLGWAERCKRAFESVPKGRALFGIVQGGDDMALRAESARALVDIGFPGYAIGGLAVGEPQEVMLKVTEETAPSFLPTGRAT